MTYRIARVGLVSVVMLVAAGQVAEGIAEPPKGPNPVEKVPQDATQIGDTKFHLAPPPADTWTSATKAGVQNTIAFMSKKRDALMAIQMLPADFVLNDDVKAALIKQLKDAREKSKSKVFLEPTVEADDRFALKIHERYETKDGKVSDQLHIYRLVGQRVAMGTINAVADDPVAVAAYHKAGEDVILSIAPKAKGAATRPGK